MMPTVTDSPTSATAAEAPGKRTATLSPLRHAWLLCALVLLSVQPAIAAPFISSFSPTSGAPGTAVTIGGSGLSRVVDVFFGSGSAQFTIVSDSQINALVPPDATTGPITVNANIGTYSTKQNFTAAPRISDFFPTSAAPGSSITIDGANFISGGTTVKFNGVTASAQVTADTQIQAVVPSGSKSGPISVTTSVGTATTTNLFVIFGSGPVITDASPGSGSPGDQITLTGVTFTGATAVRFNGTTAVFSVTADTQIIATVPVGATTGPISVVSPQGTGFSDFHFVVTHGEPVVTGFTPVKGAPGDSVTVSGLNFTGATNVTFATLRAHFAITADTQMQAIVPTGAVTGPITVTTPSGSGSSTQSFQIVIGPSIDSFTPTNGQAGAIVLIQGSHFTGATAVSIAGAPAVFEVTADTQIQAVVNSLATNGPVVVTTPAGTATSAGLFLVVTPGPLITDFSPKSGKPGDLIMLTGVYFTGATNVSFNGTSAAFEVTADTQIQTLVPSNASTGPITVTSPSGTNTTAKPFYVAPQISSISPTNGIPGTVITILGSNLKETTAVTFNGTNATFVINSSNSITATVPPAASSGPVTVVTPGGTGISAATFIVRTTIASFSPIAGPAGTVVTIKGTSFTGATSVSFNSAKASYTVAAPDTIIATVPPDGRSGGITVVSPYGTATSSASFSVSISGDLILSMSDQPGPALVGNPVVYLISVTNLGPSIVNNVLLTNRLPAGATFVTATNSLGTFSHSGAAIIFNLGTFFVGSHAVCSVVVLPPSTGILTNSASVSGTDPDPDRSNNSATLQTDVQGPFGINLVRNGDAESGDASDGLTVVAVPGWETASNLTVVAYGTGPAFPSPTTLGPPNRGAQFFWGGSAATISAAAQTVNISAAAQVIDASLAAYALSGYLGGFQDDTASATFSAAFLGANGTPLATATIGPVTAATRTNTTCLLPKAASGFLPVGTRQIRFQLLCTSGSETSIDAFADNLAFQLTPYAVPQLAISLNSPTNVVISWPALLRFPFVLQTTSKLPPTAGWSAVTNIPVTIGDRLVVTNRFDSPRRFYRLRSP